MTLKQRIHMFGGAFGTKSTINGTKKPPNWTQNHLKRPESTTLEHFGYPKAPKNHFKGPKKARKS